VIIQSYVDTAGTVDINNEDHSYADSTDLCAKHDCFQEDNKQTEVSEKKTRTTVKSLEGNAGLKKKVTTPFEKLVH